MFHAIGTLGCFVVLICFALTAIIIGNQFVLFYWKEILAIWFLFAMAKAFLPPLWGFIRRYYLTLPYLIFATVFATVMVLIVFLIDRIYPDYFDEVSPVNELTNDVQDDTKIVDLRVVDEMARPVFQVEPNYPHSLKAARIGGYVELTWVIDVNGNVIEPEVVKSSHREFNQPTIESIMQSKWSPAIKDGKPVAVRVSQRIDFNP